MNKMPKGLFTSLAIFFIVLSTLHGQIDNQQIKKLIQAYKEDVRGPYKDIRWFCIDGKNIGAKEKCPEPGGYQRARYKDEVVKLGNKSNVFLGQILKGNTQQEFFNKEQNYTKAKQYIIESFLRGRDDGWVLQKAQYYRGAIQAEDEEDWGRSFLLWIFDNANYNPEFFYLNRELTKVLPHGELDNTLQKIRSISKNIADKNSAFMVHRTKIHGSPDVSDLAKVETFLNTNKAKLSTKDISELDELIDAMKLFYGDKFYNDIRKLSTQLSKESTIADELQIFLKEMKQPFTEAHMIRGIDILSSIKPKIVEKRSAKNRLLHMDLSVVLEQYIISQMGLWQPNNIADRLSKACHLGKMINASGYTYDWEFEHLLSEYTSIPEKEMKFDQLLSFYKALRRNINWASGMIESEFGNEIKLFSGFEPLTNGFIDDRIRSSALLPLGDEASKLYEFLVAKAGWKSEVFGKNYASIQGINPGFAKGKLIVVDKLEDQEIDPMAIYLIRTPPADLEPVAGILSISEGNLVSHLQLLARNLGIPNSNVSEDLYQSMTQYNGREIFYAVSNRGGVKLILAEKMTKEEKQLFAVKSIDEEVVTVPIDKMLLTESKIYKLSEIDESRSGVICGPKAANFAALKKMFPEHLVNGLVISFAIFKDHMLQTIPGEKFSYWDYLNETFSTVTNMKSKNEADAQIEAYTLDRLKSLSALIKQMPLKPSFVKELESAFSAEFGKSLGNVPVFLRSDTNMEDLKDFTGAGLNLTIFNTTSRDKVLQGIKDVWASPYSARSYKWRQSYLTNPQDVYPSILVIPSVIVDYSGVIITKDFAEGKEGRINVALSQGVGGAVDGQKAEAWVLSPDGQDFLLSPARDRNYKKLGKSEGTVQEVSQLNSQILSDQNKKDIWKILSVVYSQMPKTGMQAPYDIELGFAKGKLWLFQIRPFVENKKATSSIYLSTLDPTIPNKLKIDITNEYK